MGFFLLLLTIWMLGYIATVLWDAFVGFGFGFEFYGETNPPIFIAAIIWPGVFFVTLFIIPTKALAGVKKKRIARQAAMARLRVEQEQSEREVLWQVEEELQHKPFGTRTNG